MTLLMGDQENLEEGRKEGAYESRVEIAKTLITMKKNSLQEIAEITGLDLEEVEDLASDASCVKI